MPLSSVTPIRSNEVDVEYLADLIDASISRNIDSYLPTDPGYGRIRIGDFGVWTFTSAEIGRIGIYDTAHRIAVRIQNLYSLEEIDEVMAFLESDRVGRLASIAVPPIEDDEYDTVCQYCKKPASKKERCICDSTRYHGPRLNYAVTA
jgi:hypothetical protein